MRRYILFLLMVSIPFVMVACSEESNNNNEQENNFSDNTSSGETTILRLADNMPDDYPTVLGAKQFAKLVEEKTNGRYEIEVYSGGQLGDEKSVIEQLQLGSIDLARVNGVPLTEFNDNIGVLNLPYLFETQEEKWEVWNGEVGEEILDSFLDNNLIGLAFYDNGERFFYNSQRPVESLEDMEGLKIRVQESDLAIAIVEALGASATPMSYDEVYSAIQTGVIDGGENNFPSYLTSAHYEVAEYATLPGYQSVPEVLIGSKQLWDDLSDEDKEIFKEAAKESIDTQREAWDELVEEAREEIEAAGNEIIEIDDISEWREAVQPVYDEFADQYQEWLDKIQK